jgi:molybdenum cofactor synthesis domain-containing protein
VTAKSWRVVETGIIPDEVEVIRQKLVEWADSNRFDVLLTTGGTGFASRDVTPEATRQIVERLTPGLDEAMRTASLRVTPHAMLSRAISGIRKQTLIINLPGSPKGALENFQVVIPVLVHAVELLHEDPHSEKGHLASNP